MKGVVTVVVVVWTLLQVFSVTTFMTCLGAHGARFHEWSFQRESARTEKSSARDDEVGILLAFREGINDSRTVLNNWSSNSSNPCLWIGVTCDATSHHVTTLSLPNFAFEGEISAQLGGLAFLERLDLSYNLLHGPIPASLGNCSRLSSLTLSANRLTGVIPMELGLTSLEVLDLSFNNFHGSIPASLGNCSRLSSFRVAGSSLTGVIPAELGLPFLEVLELIGNDLQGSIPGSLGNSRLSELNLANNALTGAIPPELGKLVNLTRLAASRNQLTGPLPPHLGNCTALEALELMFNDIDGAIPASFGNLTQLQQVYLNNNRLSGEIPASLGHCLELESLGLQHNQLEKFPAEVLALPRLRQVSLYGNSLSGALFEGATANLSVTLQFFLFQDNDLSGTIPASSFNDCANLMILNVSGNSFSGALPHPPTSTNISAVHSYPPVNGHILLFSRNNFDGELPSSLSESPFISMLDVSHNRITGAIVSPFCAADSVLSFLYLHDNQFTGEFPPGLVNCSQLQDLRLNDNLFSGSLPKDLWQVGVSDEASPSPGVTAAPSLLRLDLSNNSFSGEVPTSFLSVYYGLSLEFLRLGNNLLSGNLDSVDFKNFPVLKSLSLTRNRFTGEIPKSLENCASLQLLDLSWNEFSGHIPNLDSSYLSLLRVLKLGSNSLQGGIPSWIVGLVQLQILDLSDNLLEGTIPNNLTSLLGMSNSSSGWPNDSETLQETIVSFVDGNSATFQYILRTQTIVDLSTNSLSGKIPSEVGDLKGLKHLNLSNNRLSGFVDGSIGSIPGLESIDLSRNELSGPVSSFLGSVDIGYLNLSYNNFSGNIPTTNFPSSSYLPGNDYLCSRIVLNRSCTLELLMTSYASSTATHFSDWASIVAVEVGAVLGFCSMGVLLLLLRQSVWT